MSKPASRTLSRAAIKKRIYALIVLALAVGAITYPPAANTVIDKIDSWFGFHLGHIDKGYVLGLDLQGGTHLEYEADVSKVPQADRQSAVDGVRDVIERRVNSLGVSEPLVTTARSGASWRVTVELAGISDVNQAIKLIGETPTLEFKEQNTEPTRPLTADEQKQMDANNVAIKKKAEADLAKAIADPSTVEAMARDHSYDDAVKAAGGDLGFIKDKPQYAPLYSEIKDYHTTGTVVPQVLDAQDVYVVAKIEDVKEAGQEVRASHILIQYAGAQSTPSSTTMTKDQAKAKAEEILKQLTPENFAAMAKKYSQEPGAAQSGGDLGWFGKGDMVPAFEDAAFKLQKGQISDVVETPFGYHIILKTDERPVYDIRPRVIYYKKSVTTDFVPSPDQWKSTGLTGKQLQHAQLDFDQQSGSAQVSLQFNDEGTKLFADITKRNVGKPVAIFLDGTPISEPVVQTEIPNGQAVINGNFTIDDAKQLAQRLQAGALPVPINLVSQETVGPTLGKDSVNKSLVAGLYGFLFIALFMLFWYRLPGLFAIFALVLYVGVSGAIFKLVPVTLTLSGIAGFILSLGIAVDANVLVFERLKEELKSGRSPVTALEEGFKRAWPSIRDGNATTLIACAVLYMFTSASIKGFALTLAIGVMVSLFTAIFVTRTFLRSILGTRLPAKMPWLFMHKKTSDE